MTEYTFSQAVSYGYYITLASMINYPDGLFTNVQNINAVALQKPNGVTICAPYSPNTTAFNCRLYAPYNSVVRWTGSVSIHVIGTWK